MGSNPSPAIAGPTLHVHWIHALTPFAESAVKEHGDLGVVLVDAGEARVRRGLTASHDAEVPGIHRSLRSLRPTPIRPAAAIAGNF